MENNILTEDYVRRQLNFPAIKKAKSLVLDWRSNFGLPIGKHIEKPKEEDKTLANNLIVEEYTEYLEAVAKKDLVGQVDALADLFFVIVQRECVEDRRFSGGYKKNRIPSVGESVEALFEYPLHVYRYLDCYQAIANQLGSEFMPVIREVYNSNMSKLCSTLGEVEATKEKYKDLGIDTYHKLIDLSGKFIVKRSSDSKVLKGINFKEPDLKEFTWVLE